MPTKWKVLPKKKIVEPEGNIPIVPVQTYWRWLSLPESGSNPFIDSLILSGRYTEEQLADMIQRGMKQAAEGKISEDLPLYREAVSFYMSPDDIRDYRESLQAKRQKRQGETAEWTTKQRQAELDYNPNITWQQVLTGKVADRGGGYKVFQPGNEPIDKYWMQSPENRLDLLRGVQSGLVPQEEAYGPGSAWETWARERNARSNQELLQDVIREAVEQEKPLAQRLAQAGYPEQAQNYLNTMASLARQGGLESEGAGLTRLGYQNLVSRSEGQRRLQELRIIASEYPEWYQKYMQTRAPKQFYASDYKSDIELSGGRDVPEGASPMSTAAGGWISAEDQLMTGFGSYLQNNPEFEKARVTKEAGMLKEWPGLYDAYQEARPSMIGGEYKSFMDWVETNPLAKATYLKQREIKERPQQSRIPAWATRRV